MRQSAPFGFAACLLLAAVTAGPAAHAQSDADRATARALGQDGGRALEQKNYPAAEDAFRRADSLFHAPTLLLGLARALAAQDKLVSAREAYLRIVREGAAPGAPAVFLKAIEDAKKEVQGIEPRIGGVTITVHDAAGGEVGGVNVDVDGAPVSVASLGVRRAVDPGEHTVHVAAPGYLTVEKKLSVPAGGSVDAPVSLEKDPWFVPPKAPEPPAPAASPVPPPAPAPPPSSKGPPVGAWVAFGVGGAGLALGAVAGVLAATKHADLVGICDGDTCTPAQHDAITSYRTMGLLSTVGFAVAGAGAATGLTLMIIAPRSDGAPATGLRVAPAIGLGTVGAVGRF